MPPHWVDDDGQVSRTIPCAVCGQPVPMRRVRASRWAPPLRVERAVPWCGHGVERLLVPERGGWLREVPVVGVAK